MKRMPIVILVAALVSLGIGATLPVAVVPLAGSVRISGLSWGGELRTAVLALCLAGAIGLYLFRRPGLACFAASVAFGILLDMGMAAYQWYTEKMAMLTSSGLLGKDTALTVSWKWPGAVWVLGVLLTAIAAVTLATQAERRPDSSSKNS